MLFQVLATLTIFIHFAFIVFATFGGLLGLVKPRWVYFHLPALCWGVYIELSHGTCPLTPLENWFRQQAGLTMYEGNFIDYYLSMIVYPPSLTPGHQLVIAAVLLAINLLVYAFIWRKYRANRY